MSCRAWITALAFALGCSQDDATAPVVVADPGPEVPLVDPVWAGCDEYGEATCVLWRGPQAISAWDFELRAWIDVAPSTPLDVRIDGQITEARHVPADAGTRLHVPLPASAKLVEITGPGVEGRIEIRVEPLGADLERAALSLEGSQDHDAACKSLRAIGNDRAWRDRVRAAAALARHCLDGTDTQRMLGLERAAELATEAGFGKTFVTLACAAAYFRLERAADVEGARRWLERVRETAEGLREAEVLSGYYWVLLFERTSDPGRAVEPAVHALRWAERLGVTDYLSPLMEQQGVVLAELGRGLEAVAYARRVLALSREEPDACTRGRMINNATWTQQLLAEAGLPHDPVYDDMVEEMRIYEDGECVRPRGALHARINVARAALDDAEFEIATSWIEPIDLADPDLDHQELRAEVVDLRARIALGTGDWAFHPQPLLVEAPATGAVRSRWQSAVREAKLLERFGLDQAAVEEWRRAEEIVEATVAARFDPGSEQYISAREESVRGLVDALVRAGRIDEALCSARIARGRALRHNPGLGVLGSGAQRDSIAAHAAFLRGRGELMGEANEDWRFAGDELERRRARRRERAEALSVLLVGDRNQANDDCAMLSKVAAAELIVLVLPLTDGTLVLSDRGHGALAYRREPIPDDAPARKLWAEALWDAMSDQVDGVERIRLLPIGRAWDIEFHAASWRGAPLVAAAAVSYAVDLPTTAARRHASREALVVADPSGDLPLASSEAEIVETRLLASGWKVHHSVGTSTTRPELLDRLGAVELFHYAGHGVHRGVDGWDAALLLQGDEAIEVRDVLSLPKTPRWVTLTGCETGTVSAALLDGGMSLGRAFLLAGSEGVVVSDRRVGDEVAQAIGTALYPATDDATFDLVGALATAQASFAARGAPSIAEWSAFRVLVR